MLTGWFLLFSCWVRRRRWRPFLCSCLGNPTDGAWWPRLKVPCKPGTSKIITGSFPIRPRKELYFTKTKWKQKSFWKAQQVCAQRYSTQSFTMVLPRDSSTQRKSLGKPRHILSAFRWASLVAHLVKNPPAMQQTWVWSLGWEEPLEKGKATY